MKKQEAPSVDLTPEELALLRSVFRSEPRVLIFGSRALGTSRPFSDLDLCIQRDAPIPLTELAAFRDLLRESNLPYLVDLIDYATLSPGFRKIVDETGRPLQSVLPKRPRNQP